MSWSRPIKFGQILAICGHLVCIQWEMCNIDITGTKEEQYDENVEVEENKDELVLKLCP